MIVQTIKESTRSFGMPMPEDIFDPDWQDNYFRHGSKHGVAHDVADGFKSREWMRSFWRMVGSRSGVTLPDNLDELTDELTLTDGWVTGTGMFDLKIGDDLRNGLMQPVNEVLMTNLRDELFAVWNSGNWPFAVQTQAWPLWASRVVTITVNGGNLSVYIWHNPNTMGLTLRVELSSFTNEASTVYSGMLGQITLHRVTGAVVSSNDLWMHEFVNTPQVVENIMIAESLNKAPPVIKELLNAMLQFTFKTTRPKIQFIPLSDTQTLNSFLPDRFRFALKPGVTDVDVENLIRDYINNEPPHTRMFDLTGSIGGIDLDQFFGDVTGTATGKVVMRYVYMHKPGNPARVPLWLEVLGGSIDTDMSDWFPTPGGGEMWIENTSMWWQNFNLTVNPTHAEFTSELLGMIGLEYAPFLQTKLSNLLNMEGRTFHELHIRTTQSAQAIRAILEKDVFPLFPGTGMFSGNFRFGNNWSAIPVVLGNAGGMYIFRIGASEVQFVYHAGAGAWHTSDVFPVHQREAAGNALELTGSFAADPEHPLMGAARMLLGLFDVYYVD